MAGGWEVVGETPAAGNGGWNVVGETRPPAPPVSYGRQVSDTLAGEIGAAGTALANIPHGIVHGVNDIARRLGVPVGTQLEDALHVEAPDATKRLAQNVSDLPPVQALSDLGNRAHAAVENIPHVGRVVSDVLDNTAGVAGDVSNVLPLAGAGRVASGVGDVVSALRNRVPATAPVAEQAGYRVPETHPIAQSLAGKSGQTALTLHNQDITNQIAANEVGHPIGGGPLNADALAAARVAPSEVYSRVANALPPEAGQLDQLSRDAIRNAGQPSGGRITPGSPQAQAQTQTLQDHLLNPEGHFSGQQLMNELRGLRQEGHGNIASEDVSNQQLGRAQLDMARGLEGHIERNIPANADVTMQQFRDARTALAKNYTAEAALRGSDIDARALARADRNDPGMMTGGLKTIADFAANNDPVAGLGGKNYQPPNLASDLRGINVLEPSTILDPAVGTAARRILTGSQAGALERANRMFPPQSASRFAPMARPTPPGSGGLPWQPPGGSGPLTLGNELGAGGPSGPPQGPAGAIPLHEVLSHGVEQPAAPELSLGEGLGAGGPRLSAGIPFRPNLEHAAGGLALGGAPTPPGFRAPGQLGEVMAARLPDHPVGGPRTYPQPAPTPGHSAVDLPPMPGLASDELHLAPEDSWFKGPAPSLGDFPHVASQGVPDGGMLRVAQPHSTGFHHAPSLDLADFTVKPGGATEATVQHNNASWPLGDVFASPGSIEGLHALEQNKAAGVTPTHINSDGVGSPILHDVTARDVNPTKGGIIVDANTNEILKRDPSLTTQQVKALLAQWKANKPE